MEHTRRQRPSRPTSDGGRRPDHRVLLGRRPGLRRAVAALLALAVGLGTVAGAVVPAAAYQAPTTFTGSTGTAPGSVQQSWTGTGATTVANGTIGSRGYRATDYTPTVASTQVSATPTVSLTGCTVATGNCGGRGTLTVTFDRPVADPVLHIAGLGGSNRSGTTQTELHAVLTLTGGATLTKLSGGNLLVRNGNVVDAIDDATGPNCASTTSTTPYPFRATAACGSVRVNTGGAVTSLTFNVSADLTANPSATGPVPLANITTGGDLFEVVATFAEDFSDAPAGYDAGNAARHVLSDLRLGAGVTEDGAGTANATTSPLAVGGDTDDAVSGPLSLRSTDTSFSQVVQLSGVSGPARLAGWVDFNGNGTFEVGERAAVDVVAGQTSATLTWSGLTGTVPGASWARFRLGYNATQVGSPTGSADSGEVEDWPVTITPPPSLDVAKTFVSGQVDPATGVSSATYDVTVTNSGGPGSYGPLTDTPSFGPGLTRTGATWTTSGAGAPAGGSSTTAGPWTLAPGGTAIAAGATHTFRVTVTYTGTTTTAACSGPGTGTYNAAAVPGEAGPTGNNAACGPAVAAERSMTLDKQSRLGTDADGDGRGDAGDVIRYDFVVTNTGNTTVTGLTIDDALLAVTCPAGPLAPGAQVTCTAAYTVTQADVDAGTAKTNTATARGTAAGQAVSSPSDSTTTPLDRRLSLVLDKASTGVITDVDGNGPDAGDTVPYTFRVTNTGTVAVGSLRVEDPEVAVSCPTTSLAPGASTTCTATYTLTAADVADGRAVNTATASGTGPGGVAVTSPSDTETVTVPRPPVAAPDSRVTPQDVDVTLDPTGNDTPGPTGSALVPASVRLLDPATGAFGRSLVVAGQGSWTVAASGAVTFDPEPAFTGTATPVTYRVADAAGATATSTITVSVTAITPTANPDARFTPYDTTVVVDVVANDREGAPSAPLVPTTVALLDPATGAYGSSLSVAGEGTYTVDPATGAVSFDPLASFSGQARAVTYRVRDDNGTPATSTLTVTVGTPPSAVPDRVTTLQDVDVTASPLANDTPSQTGTLTPSSLRLRVPGGTFDTSVTVAGQGTWTATPAGTVVFDPVPGFSGTAQRLDYRATDSNGAVLLSTLDTVVTPVVPTAVPDRGTTAFATPLDLRPLANDRAGDPSAPLVPASLRLLASDGGPVTTLTVPGQGTFTVVGTDGTVRFTPAAGFRGETAAVRYRVADDNGTEATSTLVVAVDAPAPPTAAPDTRETPQGTATTVDVLANDAPGPTGAALDAGSVRLVDPGTGALVTTLSVPGEGTWTVQPDGRVRFAPVAAFTGTARSVAYQVADANGAVATSSVTVTVRPVRPVAADDRRGTAYETAVDVPVLANDAPGDPAVALVPGSVRLFDPVAQQFGTRVVEPGQGTWTVDGAGLATFVPETGFTGPTAALTYRVLDANGTAATATVAVTVALPPAPTASPDSATTDQGRPVTLEPLANDRTGAASVALLPGSLELLDPATGAWGTTVSVVGQGTWRVDPATGSVTFTPERDFRGTTPPLTYRVTDTTGQRAGSTLTVTVRAVTPVARDDSAATPHDRPVRLDALANDAAGAASVPLVTSSVVLDDPRATAGGKRLEVPGQGTWTVDLVDGSVRFSPEPGFAGTTTPVAYQVSDANGTTATARLTVSVGRPPLARPDTATTPQGVAVDLDPFRGDEPGDDGAGTPGTLDRGSLRLTSAAAEDGARLVVPGEGTWTVDRSRGLATFAPLPGFTGTTTAVGYAVTDSFGSVATSTLRVVVTPVVPSAADDRATTPHDDPVTLRPLENDTAGAASAPLVPASLRLLRPGSGEPVTEVVVPGEGRWTAAPDGSVTFDPVAGFSGTTTALGYRVEDANGTRASALLRVGVGAPAVARPDTRTVEQGQDAVLDALANDTAGTDGTGAPTGTGSLAVDSLRLTSAAATDGGRRLVVPGQGTWTVDRATGLVTFDPLPGFTGTASEPYAVSDSFDDVATSTLTVTVTPVVPVAHDDRGTTPAATPVDVAVLANDTAGSRSAPLVAGSVRLTSPAATDGGTRLVVDGEGTWVVDPATGVLTFTPAPAFGGTTSAVGYRVSDANGTTATALVVVGVGAAPVARPDATTTRQDVPVVLDVLRDDTAGTDGTETASGGAGGRGTLDPASLRLTSPLATDGGRTLVVAGEGTWSVVGTTGTLAFDPVPGFTGTTTAVRYAVTDSFGGTASSTATVTVTPVTPHAGDDTAFTPADRTVTVGVLGNDTAGDESAPLVPSSVRLVGAGGEPVGTLTVAGQGTWTAVTGGVTFDPLPGFEGVTSPVTYEVRDDNGTPARALVTVVVGDAPDAAPDSATTAQDEPVTVDPLANDVPGTGAELRRGSVVLASPAATDGGRRLVVPGTGVWTVDPATGRVTLDPEPAFTGPASVTYVVTDTQDNTAASTVTVTVTPVTPVARDDQAATPAGREVVLDVLANDERGAASAPLVPGSVRLTSTDATDGGRTLVVVGQGTYRVAPDGTVAFAPAPGFHGAGTPVTYSVADDNGTRATAQLRITVGTGPVARPDTATTLQDVTRTLDPLATDTPGDDGAGRAGTLDPTSVRLTSPDAVDGGRTLVVARQGTWTVDPATGLVTFDPLPGFTGQTSAVRYRVVDSFGGVATSTLTVTVTPVTPVAVDDAAVTDAATPVAVQVLANDRSGDATAPLDAGTVVLTSSLAEPGGRVLVVPGEGRYEVTAGTGTVTFTPVEGFSGPTTPVEYEVRDDNGTPAYAFLTVTVGEGPRAFPDTATTRQDEPVGLDPVADDQPGSGRELDRRSVLLTSPQAAPGGRSLEVAGVGTWTVDPDGGTVRFDPVPTFVGTASASYSVSDGANRAVSTMTVTVTAVVPRADDDTASTPAATPVLVDVLAGDTAGDPGAPLDPGSVQLTSPAATDLGRRLVVADEGVWEVRDGGVLFTPYAGFSGTATPVDYSVADDNGTRASATVTVTVGEPPSATSDLATVDQGVTATLTPLDGDRAGTDGSGEPGGVGTLDPASLRLPAATDGVLVVAGEGTWRVLTEGRVSFEPLPAFTGRTSAVRYEVTDSFGGVATATLSVDVTPVHPVVADDTVSSPAARPVTVDVLANDRPGAATAPLRPESVVLVGAAGDGRRLEVPGQGTWVVDPRTGQITFTPEPTFAGVTTPPVEYEVRDANGTPGRAFLSVVVGTAPTARPDTATTLQDTTVDLPVLANDDPGQGAALRPGSVVLSSPAATDGGRTLVVPGEGTWTVTATGPDAGRLTFDPEPGFTGAATVTYVVTDTDDNSAAATATVTVTPVVPTAADDRAATPATRAVDVAVLDNDAAGDDSAPLVPGSVRLTSPAATDDGRLLDVAGEGTWTVDPVSGVVRFVPVAGFAGPTTPVAYSVADDNGTTATAEVVVTVGAAPVARPDTAATDQGVPVTVDVLADDTAGTGATLDPATLRLLGAAASPDGRRLVVPGTGTFTVVDGAVVLDPERAFTGETAPVGYEVRDSDGNRAQSTVTVVVRPLRPTAADDRATTAHDTVVAVEVTANDAAGAPSAPLVPSSVRLVDPATGAPALAVDVAGEGRWTVDAAGVVRLDPDPDFAGTTTPLRYTVADTNGTSTTAEVRVEVALPAAPTAQPDLRTTAQGVRVELDPLGNDAAAPGVDLVRTSVVLTSPAAEADGRRLVVPGEGTWTLDATTGRAAFTPERGFTGRTTPVDYAVSDEFGQTARSTLQVDVTAVRPVVSDDTAASPAGRDVRVDVLANDRPGAATAPLDPTSVRLTDPAATDDGRRLLVAGQGTWTVDPTDGSLTFRPEPGFEGVTTPPVAYEVADANGTTGSALVSITVGRAPTAAPDRRTVEQDTTTDLDPLVNDQPGEGATLVPASLRLASADAEDGGTRLTVPGEGTWTVQDGTLRFDPEPGFTGTASVTYLVSDTDDGTAAGTAAVTVTPVVPVAADDTATTPSGTPVTLPVTANDTAGAASAPLVAASVRLTSPAATAEGTRLAVPGQGTWQVLPDGQLRFTPEAGSSGLTTPVGYSVADDNGTRAEAEVTVVVGEAPVARPDLATTEQDEPVALDPLANDDPGTAASLDRTSVRLTSTAATADGRELVVPGVGRWSVVASGPDAGRVTFDPVPSFTGRATTTYAVSDSDGVQAVSTLSVDVQAVRPVAVDDVATTPATRAVTVDVVGNDVAGSAAAPLDRSSVVLTGPGASADGSRLVVAGVGSWQVLPGGRVTFTPETGFVGVTDPVTYRVADDNGTTDEALLTVTVGAAPVARPDRATTDQGVATTLDPLANDTAGTGARLDAGSVELYDPETGTWQRSLTLPGEGSWTVDPTTGAVTFDPVRTLVGRASVTYRVRDSDGNATASTLVVTVEAVVPVAVGDDATTPHRTPVVLDVLANDAAGAPSAPLVEGSVRFTSPAAGDAGRTLVVAGEGTWTAAPDGTVTFAPAAGFAGTATPVEYAVDDANGTTATALLRVVVGAPAVAQPDRGTTRQGAATELAPLANDRPGTDGEGRPGVLDPQSVRLTDPGAAADGLSLELSGVGTFTVDPGTGRVSFVPDPAFTGTTPDVGYAVTDSFGTVARSTLSVEVTPVVPTASDDTVRTPAGTPVTVAVLDDDRPGDPSAPLVPASLRLVDPATGDLVETLVVAGGTWTVTAGRLRLEPEAGFAGATAPATYSVADTNGTRATALVTATVGAAPVAADDTASTPQGVARTVDVAANDRPGEDAALVPGSVLLADPAATDGGRRLVVAGEGTWTVEPDGQVTFTPVRAFTGDATTTYSVADTDAVRALATVTVTVVPVRPTAVDDTAATPAATPVVVPVLDNDRPGAGTARLDATSVRLVGAPGDGRVLVVAGEGTWTVNPDTGAVRFVPEAGLAGPTSPVRYSVADANGVRAEALVTVSVGSAPVARPDRATTRQDLTVTLDPLADDTAGTDGAGGAGTLRRGSVVLLDDAAVDGGRRLEVPGEGSWTVDPSSGEVTFDPLPGFTGVTRAVRYRVTDSFGGTATSDVRVEVAPIRPDADDDAASTPAGRPVEVAVLANDDAGDPSAPLVPTSVVLTDPRAVAGGTRLEVPGQGTWTVGPAGTVTFAPVAGFEGVATPVAYRVSDDNGSGDTATVTVTVGAAPTARPDRAATDQGSAVTLDPTANDAPGEGATLDRGSVVLTSPDATDGGRRLVVPGEGTWTVDPATGVVGFEPDPQFTGAATATYAVRDSDGSAAVAVVTVDVVPVVPVANDDVATTPANRTVVVDVLANDAAGSADAPLDPATVVLTSPAATDGGKRLVVAGEGTYQVRADGAVSFTPVTGFSGLTTPVTYEVSDTNGTVTSAVAQLTVTVGAAPTAQPDSLATVQGRPVEVDPLLNDAPGTGATLDRRSVLLSSPSATDGGRTLVVPGAGTWTVDPATGHVRFAPLPGFVGERTTTYTVRDSDGGVAAAVLTVRVDPVRPVVVDDTATTGQGSVVVVRVLDNDAPGDPGVPLVRDSVRLVDPATGEPVRELVVAGQGTWTALADGTVRFAPEAGFEGVTTPPVSYTVADANGTVGTGSVSVQVGAGARALPDDGATPQDVELLLEVLANDAPSDGAQLVPGSVVLADAAATDGGTRLVEPGQGTWRVDPQGRVAFDPEPAFVGTASTLYRVTDDSGRQAAATVTVTVTPVTPVAVDDVASTPSGRAVDVAVLANDRSGAPSAALDPGTLLLTDPRATDGGLRLQVPGQGAYAVDPAAGTVRFTPVPGFAGATTPVGYRVADDNGTTATATLAVTVGEGAAAVADEATTAQGVAVDLDPAANDVPGTGGTLDRTSVRLDDPAATDDGRTLVQPGVGTWRVDPVDGTVRFAPVPSFTGVAAAAYALADDLGSTARATMRVEVTPVTPVALDDSAETPAGRPVVVAVLANDRAGAATAPLVPSSVRLVDPATGEPVGSLDVAAGRWSAQPDGTLVFTPARGFEGVVPGVTYQVADSNGTTARGVVGVTVGAGPRALPDRASTDQGVAAEVDVVANDTTEAAQLDRSSVVFADPAATDGGATLVEPGQGTWRADDRGRVTFTPEPRFTGTASVVYTVTDADGNQAASTVVVEVLPVTPVPADDRAATPNGRPVEVDVLANDRPGAASAPLDRTSVRLTGPQATDGGRRLTVPGEGSYAVDRVTGAVRFTPVPGFEGSATPVTYEVADANGTVAAAVLLVTVEAPPVARPDRVTARQGADAAVLEVLANDTAGPGATLDPASVVLLEDGAADDGRTLVVPGVGRWTVDPATGRVRLQPERGFTGPATVRYAVTDSDGVRAVSTARVDVTPVVPRVADDAAGGPAGAPVVLDALANDAAGDPAVPLDPATLRLVDPASGDPVTALVVAGQGTWEVLPGGRVRFTPEPGFAGATAPVQYAVADANGTTGRALLTATVGEAPRAVADRATTPQGTAATVDVLGNDSAAAGLDATSVDLVTPAGPVDRLVVPGEGTWTVDPATGAVGFEPLPGFTGTATVTYSVADADGVRATATVSVEVLPVTPVARDDAGRTPAGEAVTVDVLANDAAGADDVPLQPGTLRLVDPATGAGVTTLVVPGVGTFSAGADGVRFTPEAGFAGPATVAYQVEDANGTLATAELTVEVVAPPVPVAEDDRVAAPYGQPVLVDVLGNDTSGLDPATLRLVDPVSGDLLDTLVVPGEGEWTVQPGGRLRFEPVPGFAGAATPVTYSVAGDAGDRVTAEVRVRVAAGPAVADDAATGAGPGRPVTVPVLANDAAGEGCSLRPGSVVLASPDATDGGKRLVVPGEGTWTVTPQGELVFTPEPGFAGDATPVAYAVSDDCGSTGTGSVRVSVPGPTVDPQPGPQPTPQPGSTPGTGTGTGTDAGTDAGTGVPADDGDGFLPNTGGPRLALVGLALAMLVLGLGLLRRRAEEED